jgi:hypothetical protein
MRLIILLTSIFFIVCPAYGQEDSISPIREVDNIFTAVPKTKNLSIDLSSAEEVDQVLKKIHTFKYLESISFEGEAAEGDLKKLFFRISTLKNVSEISFKENELVKIPENISMLKNLQSLSIEGNIELDYADLFTHLKNTKIVELYLLDNDLKKVPATLGEITSLKKLQLSGNDKMDYTELVETLSKIPGLNTLSIPLNYITELPKNINKLSSLTVLDVSNNNLTELPGEISGLKTINNLSIQGNLLLDPVKDLEKLKGNKIQYLALDKEIGGAELEEIKKLFPDAQIDFPVNKELEEVADTKKTEKAVEPAVYNGELKVLNETTVLSGAYLSYPTFFAGLDYNMDTLKFEERYANLQYENTRRIVRGFRTNPALYMRDNCMRLEKPGKKKEIWFRFATDDARLSNAYPELRTFSGMYWVYKGDLSKRKFRKKFLKKRARPDYRGIFGLKPLKRKMPIRWNDVRIDYSKNNSLFTITLKSDTGFVSFPAYPLIADISVERSQQTYHRRHMLYKKALLRRKQRFERNLARSKRQYDNDFKRLSGFAWKELQIRMSNEEKAMSKETWLNYYDNIIANERKALDKSALNPQFIMRSLQLRNYTILTSSAQVTQSVNPNGNFANKMMNADFINAKDSSKLVVLNIFILDNKRKIVEQITGTLGLTPNLIPIKQYTSQTLLVELRNGNWGFVNAGEIDKELFDPNKVFRLHTQLFDKNLDTIGDLLNTAIK